MRKITLLLLFPLFVVPARGQEDPARKAQQVIEASIEAMGGQAYLSVRNAYSKGRYFPFRRGRRGFTYFTDWTVFDPVKSHNRLGKGKNFEATIINLEINRGWVQEGKHELTELTPEQIKAWADGLTDNLDMLLRKRRHEEGMSFFYYGADDIAGAGQWEAVEFLDATNAGVVVFFRLDNHLPAKVEYSFVDGVGVRHTRETEFYNWHDIEGVLTPLRTDVYVDDEMSAQFFVEELDYDVQIPPGHFLEPVIEKKD